MANTFNPSIKQGADYQIILKPRQPDGSIFDWTGYQFASQIREQPDSEDIAAEFSITPNSPESGDLSLTLTAKQTRKLECKTYAGFDVLMVDPLGKVTELVSGKPTVRPGTSIILGVNDG